MHRDNAFHIRLNFNRAAARAQRNFAARSFPFSLEQDQRAGGHKGVPPANRFGPIGKIELILAEISVSSIGPGRYPGSHLVSSSYRRQTVATVQVTIPIQKTQIVKRSARTAGL